MRRGRARGPARRGFFCLADGPRILDCLEFDDRLRLLDGLDDAAFLAMDLERLGARELAERFTGWYAEFSGAVPVRSLQHHDASYRAFVRAKVSCIRAAQGDRSSVSEIETYVDLALTHARAAQVSLVLVGGAPGTGKTTLAAGLADRMGGVLLSSDRVRTEVAGVPPDRRYAPEGKAATYAELLHRAEQALRHGEDVVLDATWGAGEPRRSAEELAARTCSRLFALECRVDPAVAAARAERRLLAGTDSSEAGAQVSRALAAAREAWPQARAIDTSGTAKQSLAELASRTHGADYGTGSLVGRARAGDGCAARISRSPATNRSDSVWPRCQVLRPKISPSAPASIDSRAFSSIASSPARSPPETSTSVRLADLTTAPIASRLENSRVVLRLHRRTQLGLREVHLDHIGSELAHHPRGVVDRVDQRRLAALGLDGRPAWVGPHDQRHPQPLGVRADRAQDLEVRLLRGAAHGSGSRWRSAPADRLRDCRGPHRASA